MTNHIPSRPRFLAVALAVALGSISGLASAAITYGNYTLDAQYILGSSSGTPNDAVPESSISTYYSIGADLYFNKNSGTNSIIYHTYGNESYWGSSFGARASGEGSFYGKTSINYSNVFTNSASTAQNLLFSFGVQEGELAIAGGGDGFAELLLRIRVNGVDFALDKTTLVMSGGVTACSNSSLGVLGSYMDCGSSAVGNSLYASGRNYTVDLGLVAAGASVSLDYDIVSTVYGDLTNGEYQQAYYVCDEWDSGYGWNGDGYGYANAMAAEVPGSCLRGHYETYTVSSPGTAIARSGDPVNYYFQPAGPSGVFTNNQVPEPSALLLMLGALSGFALAKRYRRI